MAFSGNYMCTSFKQEILKAVHNLSASGGNSFKMALYTNSASFDAATTAYTSSNEVSGTGYSAGGKALTNVDPLTSGTTAYAEYGDQTWSTSTITARGALIYNDTASGDPTVVVLDFGSDKSSSAGDFAVVMPTFNSSSALIRIA
jgi:FlaG/FlaF family flagellin (archaellin)